MNQSKSFFTTNWHIVVLALICTALWGSAYPAIKIGYELFHISANDAFSKILFAGYRFALAGIFVIAFTCLMERRFVTPPKKSIPGISLLAVFQTTLQYIFFYLGLSNTTGVKSAILNAAGPLVTVVLVHFLYADDRLNVKKTVGCIIGFAGVIIINLGTGGFDASFRFDGEGFIIFAAVSFSISSIISKQVTRHCDSRTVTGYQLLIGGILLCIIGALGGGTFQVESVDAFLLFLYLAALSSVAFTLWTLLLQYNPVGKISVYNFFVPVFGVLMSGLFLGESLWDPKNLVSLLLVCFGIYIVNRPDTPSLPKNNPSTHP